MIVKNETYVSSRMSGQGEGLPGLEITSDYALVSGVARGVIYYRKLLFESDQNNLSFRRVDS